MESSFEHWDSFGITHAGPHSRSTEPFHGQEMSRTASVYYMSPLSNEQCVCLCSLYKAATHSQPSTEQECPQTVLNGKINRRCQGFCPWRQLQALQSNFVFNTATQIFVTNVSIYFWTCCQVFPQALVSLTADSERHLWRQHKAFAVQHLFIRGHLLIKYKTLPRNMSAWVGCVCPFWQLSHRRYKPLHDSNQNIASLLPCMLRDPYLRVAFHSYLHRFFSWEEVALNSPYHWPISAVQPWCAR